MYKGFGQDVVNKGPKVVMNYVKTYGSRFLKWARTPVEKIRHSVFNRRP